MHRDIASWDSHCSAWVWLELALDSTEDDTLRGHANVPVRLKEHRHHRSTDREHDRPRQQEPQHSWPSKLLHDAGPEQLLIRLEVLHKSLLHQIARLIPRGRASLGCFHGPCRRCLCRCPCFNRVEGLRSTVDDVVRPCCAIPVTALVPPRRVWIPASRYAAFHHSPLSARLAPRRLHDSDAPRPHQPRGPPAPEDHYFWFGVPTTVQPPELVCWRVTFSPPFRPFSVATGHLASTLLPLSSFTVIVPV